MEAAVVDQVGLGVRDGGHRGIGDWKELEEPAHASIYATSL